MHRIYLSWMNLPPRLIEERFGYLTGRVTAYERAQFLDGVAAEPALSPEQRAEVRRLVEEWATRDSGA